MASTPDTLSPLGAIPIKRLAMVYSNIGQYCYIDPIEWVASLEVEASFQKPGGYGTQSYGRVLGIDGFCSMPMVPLTTLGLLNFNHSHTGSILSANTNIVSRFERVDGVIYQAVDLVGYRAKINYSSSGKWGLFVSSSSEIKGGPAFAGIKAIRADGHDILYAASDVLTGEVGFYDTRTNELITSLSGNFATNV